MTVADEFYLKFEEPLKSCLMALREIILKSDKAVAAAWKYHMPVFCYKGKMFCYLWVDKKTHQPYVGIVEGKRISHASLEQGNRSRMKILRVNPYEDIRLKELNDILKQALDLYRKGTIKI